MKFIGELTQGKATKKVTVLHEGSVLAEGTLAVSAVDSLTGSDGTDVVRLLAGGSIELGGVETVLGSTAADTVTLAIGGSLANNDPAACYPAAVLALNATINTDRRSIAADDFFKGMFETALGEGEIITAVSFPVPASSL